MFHNCAMQQGPPIFSLYHCSQTYSLSVHFCLCLREAWWLSSWLHNIGALFILGNKPLIGPLKSIVAWLSIPGPISVDCICNKARFRSWLVSKHFFIVCFITFIHDSTCPLLWLLYENNTAGWTSPFCRTPGIFPKFVPVSDIFFFGRPCSAITTCRFFIKWSADNPSVCSLCLKKTAHLF